MAKKRSGWGRGGKAARGTKAWGKNSASRTNEFRKESKNDSHGPAVSLRKKWKTGGDISLVKVADIVVPDELEKPDPDDVARLAELIRKVGVIHPVAVRRKVTAFGKRSEIELVTGRTRFESYKMLGEQMIPCTYVEDDDDLVREIQLSENLFRRDDTVLKKAELLAEWIERTEQNGDVSGQVDRKPKGGRPKSGNAQAARELLSLAKSDEGGRKQIERAIAIAKLPTAVKNAAKEAELDDNQSALLEIAKEATQKAQITKVGEFAAQGTGTGRKRRSSGMEHKATKKAMLKKKLSASDNKVLASLIEAWNDAVKRAFSKASAKVREAFIAKIRQGQ